MAHAFCCVSTPWARDQCSHLTYNMCTSLSGRILRHLDTMTTVILQCDSVAAFKGYITTFVIMRAAKELVPEPVADLFASFFEAYCVIDATSWIDMCVLQNAFFWYCKSSTTDVLLLERVWKRGTLIIVLAEQHGGAHRMSLNGCVIKGIKLVLFP